MLSDTFCSISCRHLSTSSIHVVILIVILFQNNVICIDPRIQLHADTYCQLEKMTARCRWNSEVILMTSASWGRMEANRCLAIHPTVLAALGHDPLFLGCSDNVLSLLDSKCSGRSECEIHIPDPDLNQRKPCYQDLKSYLTASYECVKVVHESRRCVVSVTTEAQFISSSTSSDVNSVSSCGSKSNPWRLEAGAGQRINISLLDFTAMSMSATDRPRDHVTCRQYGYVLEKLNKRNVSVCGGGAAELRQSHVYISDDNNVHIVLMQPGENQPNFLIKSQAVGCTNMIPPENAWLRRSNNDIIIGCYSSQQTWQLKCDGREWKGLVGTCPELYTGSVIISEDDSEKAALTIMMLITGAAVFVCITVITLGCLMFNHYTNTYNDNDTEKLTSTNGGATDLLYPSNVRRIRNNKPLDNNVLTDRLPVSAGQQHHQRHQNTTTTARHTLQTYRGTICV